MLLCIRVWIVSFLPLEVVLIRKDTVETQPITAVPGVSRVLATALVPLVEEATGPAGLPLATNNALPDSAALPPAIVERAKITVKILAANTNSVSVTRTQPRRGLRP